LSVVCRSPAEVAPQLGPAGGAVLSTVIVVSTASAPATVLSVTSELTTAVVAVSPGARRRGRGR
jgi:hypothetical protein